MDITASTMLRLIRSARSRPQRKSGADSTLAMSTASTRCSELKGSRANRLSWSRQSSCEAGDAESGPQERPQLGTVPTAVLGDATNTYCSGQRPVSVPDSYCPAKPNRSKQCFAPVPAISTSEVEADGEASSDPQQVGEYAQDIFQVLMHKELVDLPSPTYMDRQVHVNAKMRAILVDWLVDVHKKYKMGSDTLFLAVQLIDRYLEVQVTAKSHLQLVGATALMIAAKFEEVHPPQVKEFVYVTDKAYSREDVLKMEVCMLKALQFKICCPTAMHFLESYQNVNGCTDAHRDLAQYLLELSLMEYKMLKYTPSHLAAAAILLSNKLLRRPSWSTAAVTHTKMTEPMLKECAKGMCALLECSESNSLQAVRRKFSQTKYNSVAKLDFMAAPGCQAGATTSACAGRRSVGGVTVLV